MAQAKTVRDEIEISSRKDIHKLQSKAVGLVGVLVPGGHGCCTHVSHAGQRAVCRWLRHRHLHTGGVPACHHRADVFSIGYAAMAARVSSVGGFYSFISQGIGREVGMSAGITSLACYSLFEASLTGLFAFFGNKWLSEHLGINVPWLWLALFMIAVIAVLAYRDVKLSAKILGVALIAEVAILTIFVLGVVFASSGTNFNPEALNVFKVYTPLPAQTVGTVAIPAGAAAVGIFMAFWSWVGFEMAPNYAEESRDPKRIVPQSLLLSVVGLGHFLRNRQLVCRICLSDGS